MHCTIKIKIPTNCINFSYSKHCLSSLNKTLFIHLLCVNSIIKSTFFHIITYQTININVLFKVTVKYQSSIFYSFDNFDFWAITV